MSELKPIVSCVGGLTNGFGPESERIAAGGLASTTEQRLRELRAWGGSSSLFTPSETAVAEVAGIESVAQIVGLSAGRLAMGYVPATDRWARIPSRGSESSTIGGGGAEWQSHPQIIRGWDTIRRRALARLRRQAEGLSCQAVVGIRARRELEPMKDGGEAVFEFTGSAVRLEAWASRRTSPVLALATSAEFVLMLECGIEPVGVVGSTGRIELRPGYRTVSTERKSGAQMPSAELDDLTYSVYEARSDAMRGMLDEASALEASGVVGIHLEFEQTGDLTRRLPGAVFTVHALGTGLSR
jgi:uncharacterized protein YbjQ (UPF0145 family)